MSLQRQIFVKFRSRRSERTVKQLAQNHVFGTTATVRPGTENRLLTASRSERFSELSQNRTQLLHQSRKCVEKIDGDDGARTRDLCRDSVLTASAYNHLQGCQGLLSSCKYAEAGPISIRARLNIRLVRIRAANSELRTRDFRLAKLGCRFDPHRHGQPNRALAYRAACDSSVRLRTHHSAIVHQRARSVRPIRRKIRINIQIGRTDRGQKRARLSIVSQGGI